MTLSYIFIKMFIDYIYLLLIIIVICFIIFMIYLSYEYRYIEEYRYTENFEDLPLDYVENSYYNKENINLVGYGLVDDYARLGDELENRDITRDNIKNIKIYQKLMKNLNNLENLNTSILNSSGSPQNFPVDKLIKTIKSKYNSQYISTFTNDVNTYGIVLNDNCLTVNGLCGDDYCVLPCQNKLYSTNSQKFSTKRINSKNEAASAMNVALNKINSKNIYPFNIFKSLVNDDCLTLSNDGITVEKCNLNNIKQQWEISPNDNICVLN
jgi:hypothetical protein